MGSGPRGCRQGAEISAWKPQVQIAVKVISYFINILLNECSQNVWDGLWKWGDYQDLPRWAGNMKLHFLRFTPVSWKYEIFKAILK